MQYIGKIIGFFLGYQIFHGLFGGIFGAFLGHLADKKLYELGSVRSSIFGKNLTRQTLFTLTTFAVLGHLAKAKGRVTEEDIQNAQNLMAHLNLDAKTQQEAQKAFTLGKEADFPLRNVIREFREACARRQDLLRFFIQVQITAAIQDGELDAQEQQVLFTIAEAMGMSRMQFEQMLGMIMAAQQFSRGGFHQQYSQQSDYSQGSYSQGGYSGYQQSHQPSIDAAYKVLGVTANDDQNTVKRAYRKLMNENHPDKLAAKGLPDEMMELAKEKTQQIQAAYDLICKQKGWK
ncbi:co-chaperone DjlA [Haemophilus parahaemolyticus]|uniref:Co-chaperone protein DjlA n=2 Tax=Haemophilus parahaemolyticus TaxID=735 RepID=A0AAE6JPH1_HAEPH|nr:co-chaperone DjlA [Haemophilus parahaemolyticus]EIJ73545.1 DnaJ-like protein DjlA [Haemophilus parahaemolyticus HK385]OOR97822.1 molecular chaperone DjlA [Haemophilus parahaemolyticus]QEN10205.1 co-chaperone DjlA [Haemophilus parahaemolyticus]QRP13192.1 co-chaperone DjlA [Haemophilus parahaemolyticus]STO65941.1 Dna-J like membrane chaperone protein [Haemophilus parahaemolyticus HK385]